MKIDKFLLIALGALVIILLLLLALGGAAFLCMAIMHAPTITDDTTVIYRDHAYNGTLGGFDQVTLNVHDINGNILVKEGAEDSYAIDVHEKGTERSFQRYRVEFNESTASGARTLDVTVRDLWKDQPMSSLKHSADITVTVPKNKTYNVELVTVNGDIDVGSFNGSKATMTCVNGVITSSFSADRATYSNVNGDVDATTMKTAGKIDVNSVNGGVYITVPKDAGLSVDARLVNGGVRTYMALNTTEKTMFKVIGSTPGYGGNGIDIKIALVNGNIKVKYSE